MTSEPDRDKRESFLRRRRLGVVLGALLAFIFGGWLGLGLALAMVALARFVEYRTAIQ
jgi:tetrahydromethanopterin S-methyltransferase subunit B